MSPRREQRNHKKSPKKESSFRKESPHKGSGERGSFVFRDRSGKLHGAPGGPPKGHSHAAESRTREEHRPAKSFPKRPDRDRPQHDRFEKKPRKDHRHSEKRAHEPQRNHRGAAELKLKATVDKNRKGFGFLQFEKRGYEDAFIPPRQAEHFFHGDRVEVTCDSRGNVVDIEVIQHRFREIVGKYTPHPSGQESRGGWVVYERKRAREEVYVPPGASTAKVGDWVRAQLVFEEEGPYPVTAKILDVYGATLPASADVGMIAAEYNLIEEHPPEAEREAREFKLEWNPREREDLRNVPFITIDGETARDFDDAVYVERDGSGYILWVAIADVSHYVTKGTAINDDAKSRGTSVYFPERAFHMLPRALSENLCSLRPNEPRLTMVARMEYTSEGKRTKTEVMNAIIESKRRATYNEIHKEWEAKGQDPAWEFQPHFGLYQLIRKARSKRGSIDFDLPEAEVIVDATGEPTSIVNRDRLHSHRLIEEFMIAANEAVTEWMMERNWPFVYRVHEEPAEQSLDRFTKLAATVGVKVALSEENISQTLADVISRLEGHPAQTLLNTALLRSMKQAVYSAVHHIHFGLASPGYTHFTSPIRRYPDLVVHRLLKMVVAGEKLNESGRRLLETELEDIAEHCSYRERLAADADREAIRLKQVRYMVKHLGEEFRAKVTGMIEAGIFVQLIQPYVEGMISKETLSDDFYQFDEEKLTMTGKRTRRTFRIGDVLVVRCVRADIEQRQVDFALVKVEQHIAYSPAIPYDEPPTHRQDRHEKRHDRGGRGDRGRRDDRGGPSRPPGAGKKKRGRGRKN